MTHIITSDNQIITVNLSEKEIFKVELVEKEIVKVNLTVVDILSGVGGGFHLDSLVKNEIPSRLSSKLFRLSHCYQTGSLTVYFNGIKEKYIIETSSNEFELEIDTVTDDIIEVDYIRTN